MLGSSYNPQSQGYIEGRHQSINRVLAAYVNHFPGQWARWCKLAQWSLRATPLPREDRGGLSPYELVTGMKPQGPLHELFAKTGGTVLGAEGYVRGLQEHLENVHDVVKAQLRSELEQKRLAAAGREGRNQTPAVGSYVFLKRPPAALRRTEADGAGVSDRLLPRASTTLYRVKKQVGPSAVILEDANTHSSELGFAQPVAIDRLGALRPLRTGGACGRSSSAP